MRFTKGDEWLGKYEGMGRASAEKEMKWVGRTEHLSDYRGRLRPVRVQACRTQEEGRTEHLQSLPDGLLVQHTILRVVTVLDTLHVLHGAG